MILGYGLLVLVLVALCVGAVLSVLHYVENRRVRNLPIYVVNSHVPFRADVFRAKAKAFADEFDYDLRGIRVEIRTDLKPGVTEPYEDVTGYQSYWEKAVGILVRAYSLPQARLIRTAPDCAALCFEFGHMHNFLKLGAQYTLLEELNDDLKTEVRNVLVRASTMDAQLNRELGVGQWKNLSAQSQTS